MCLLGVILMYTSIWNKTFFLLGVFWVFCPNKPSVLSLHLSCALPPSKPSWWVFQGSSRLQCSPLLWRTSLDTCYFYLRVWPGAGSFHIAGAVSKAGWQTRNTALQTASIAAVSTNCGQEAEWAGQLPQPDGLDLYNSSVGLLQCLFSNVCSLSSSVPWIPVQILCPPRILPCAQSGRKIPLQGKTSGLGPTQILFTYSCWGLSSTSVELKGWSKTQTGL